MKLLLDTHALLWILQDERERLSAEARDAIDDLDNPKIVSVASGWEAGIKAAAGKLRIPDRLPDEIAGAGFDVLAIGFGHAMAAAALPPHHKDPFDRMLIAQARVEGLTIVSRDRRFEDYDVALIRA